MPHVENVNFSGESILSIEVRSSGGPKTVENRGKRVVGRGEAHRDLVSTERFLDLPRKPAIERNCGTAGPD